MQDAISKDRHQHGVRHPDQAHQSEQQEEGPDWRGPADKTKSFNDVGQRGSCTRHASGALDSHHQQADDDCDITHAVDKKAPALADLGY